MSTFQSRLWIQLTPQNVLTRSCNNPSVHFFCVPPKTNNFINNGCFILGMKLDKRHCLVTCMHLIIHVQCTAVQRQAQDGLYIHILMNYMYICITLVHLERYTKSTDIIFYAYIVMSIVLVVSPTLLLY